MQKSDILGFMGRKKILPKELAKKLNCTESMISCLISGKSKLTYDKIKKLFEMGATVEELFGVAYTGQAGQPVNLASLSDAEVKELVRRGLAGLAAGNGVG